MIAPTASDGRRSLLVIDDDPGSLASLAAVAERQGLVLITQSSWSRGALAALGRRAHFLVVEPNLPGVCWYSVLREIEAAAHHCPPARVAVATGFPSTAMANEAQRIRIRQFFAKPYDPATMIEALLRSPEVPHRHPLPCSDALSWVQWEHLNRVILCCEGQMTKAARRLRIPRQTLYRKLRKRPIF